jgi:hypothetical protein
VHFIWNLLQMWIPIWYLFHMWITTWNLWGRNLGRRRRRRRRSEHVPFRCVFHLESVKQKLKKKRKKKRTFSIQMCIPPGMWFEYGFHLESASWKENILQFRCGPHFGLCFRCGFHLVSVPHVDYHLESSSRKLKKNTIFQFRFGFHLESAADVNSIWNLVVWR